MDIMKKKNLIHFIYKFYKVMGNKPILNQNNNLMIKKRYFEAECRGTLLMIDIK